MPTTFAEWATIIGLPLTIAQTIYVALTYHSSTVAQAAGNPPRTSRRHLLIMSVIALISWSLFAAGQFLGKPKIIFADAIINKWSYNGGVFSMDVRGDPLLEFKNDDDLVLYVKPPVSGADYMTDEHGIKSKRYTIHEGIIYLVVSINRDFCSIASKTPGGGRKWPPSCYQRSFHQSKSHHLPQLRRWEGKQSLIQAGFLAIHQSATI